MAGVTSKFSIYHINAPGFEQGAEDLSVPYPTWAPDSPAPDSAPAPGSAPAPDSAPDHVCLSSDPVLQMPNNTLFLAAAEIQLIQTIPLQLPDFGDAAQN